MYKAAELLMIQNMAASVWKNLARQCQQFLLTELDEVCNYVKFSYFNSNFTYIAEAFGKSLEAIIWVVRKEQNIHDSQVL